jgi:Icc-related predicted phosphoesterase
MQKDRTYRSLFWALALAVALVSVSGSLYAKHEKKEEDNRYKPGLNTLQAQPRGYPFTFAAYGDIRFNDRDEKASDPVRRKAIVTAITLEHPDFVTISGDLVLTGNNVSDWNAFDRETAPLREAGIKIYPALGNHDVRGGPDALKNYFERFPAIHNNRWYTLRYGNCLFIVSDSDTDDSPGSKQGDWIAKQLDHAPAGVDFIFVMTHHPEYTESSDGAMHGGHSARDTEKQLAGLLEARQPKMRARIIAIAGHVHNYERYQHQGVMYLVSGGGGATPYLFDRRPDDFYKETGPTYHYMTFKVDQGKLAGEMHKLEMNGDDAHWRVADKFEIENH